MNKNFEIGDYVEHCSLMPGVLMKINGNNVEIRVLGDIEYKGEEFANCSITHCAVRKLTYEDVKMRMVLGREKLSELFNAITNHEGSYTAYDNLIREAYLEMIR